MFGISDYGAFVAAFVLLLFLPGPGNLALITSTTQGGMRGGTANPKVSGLLQKIAGLFLIGFGLKLALGK